MSSAQSSGTKAINDNHPVPGTKNGTLNSADETIISNKTVNFLVITTTKISLTCQKTNQYASFIIFFHRTSCKFKRFIIYLPLNLINTLIQMNKNLILLSYRIAILLIGFIILSPCALAQGLRITYVFQYKNDKNSNGYKTEMDMTVDFNGKHSSFYSDNRFLRDSLRLIAFDSHGNIIDDEIYGQITRMPNKSSRDVLFVDYASSAFHQVYRHALNYLKGSGTLETPKWEILGDGKEIEGYRTKMARADYMGREWTIWFTDEIPASTGPWLLFGAPGLIVKAQDSEKLFLFRMRYIEEIDSKLDRYQQLERILEWDMNQSTGIVFSGNIQDTERLYYKLRTDRDYLYQSSGILKTVVNSKEMSGSVLKYIPIIPIENDN